MKYGLGKRFGAPRRACMGRVRSLFAENGAERDRIEGRLEELRLLVTEAEPGIPPVWVLPGGGVDAEARASIEAVKEGAAEAFISSQRRKNRDAGREAAEAAANGGATVSGGT